MTLLQQIAVALGRSTPADESLDAQRWALWIGDARLQIGLKLGPVEMLDQETLDYVVREAVVAMARRPEDATEVEIAVDDGRTTKRYQTSPGRVLVIDEWLDMLRQEDVNPSAYSVRPGVVSRRMRTRTPAGSMQADQDGTPYFVTGT